MTSARYAWLVVLLLGAPSPAGAWVSPAPDVVVYCGPGLAHALLLAGMRFHREHGAAVHVFASPPAGLMGLIGHHARADVVVANAATLDALAAHSLIKAPSRRALGLDRYVLVARADAAIRPGETWRQIVGRHPVVLPDATTAASFDGRAVLGLVVAAGDLSAAPIGVADTPDVLHDVLHGTDRVGLVHASDVGGLPALAVIATAPDAQVAPTRIEGALVSAGQSADAAGFLDFLTGPAGQLLLRDDGVGAAS